MPGTPRISGAKQRWQDYRRSITEYLIQTMGVSGRILILGAGGCDDVDVAALLQAGCEVYLADVNLDAMNQAVHELKTQPVLDYFTGEIIVLSQDELSRLHTVELDMVGISEEDYEAYEQACQLGVEALTAWWHKYYDGQSQRRKMGLEPVDCVLALGLHSQLYIDLIRRIQGVEGITMEVMREAIDYVKTANAQYAASFLRDMKPLTKQVLIGLEYTTLEPDGELQTMVLNTLTTEGTQGLQAMGLSRVEGAYQMEQEVIKTSGIQDRQYLLWPFSKDKTYLMVLYWIMMDNVI